MSDHEYRLKYDLTCETGKFTNAECEEFGGGTDALAVLSLLYPEDGSFSLGVMSVDGRNPGAPLSAYELFKVWFSLAAMLAKNEDLDERRRECCASAVSQFMSK